MESESFCFMRLRGEVRSLILFLFVFVGISQGVVGENKVWRSGYTFLNFLEDYQVPLRFYYNLPAGEKELTAEIRAGVEYQVLKDKDEHLIQALIPIDEEVQIHIYRENFQYKVSFIPIRVFEKPKNLAISIDSSPHQDIFTSSQDFGLANEFLNIYRNSINFKRDVRKGDRLAIIYDRKYRFGRFFGTPMVKAVMIETTKNPNYLISYDDGRFYDLSGKEVTGFLLQMPLNSISVTSNFSKARAHPVLPRTIKAHFGVDFRAKLGTAVYAAGSGKVISAGWKGGYGKAVEITHEGGLRTLYAHLSKIDSKIKVGNYIKRGTIVGRSGNTGLSSGPHLHFGLYKNGRPINPLGSIQTTKSILSGKKKNDFLKLAQTFKGEIETLLEEITSEQKERANKNLLESPKSKTDQKEKQ